MNLESLMIYYLKALRNKWSRDVESGFMPDPEGDKIAKTRTGSCRNELERMIEIFEQLQATEYLLGLNEANMRPLFIRNKGGDIDFIGLSENH